MVHLRGLDAYVVRAEDILNSDVIEASIERAMARLAPGARQAEVDRLQGDLAAVVRVIDNVTGAIANGGEMAALVVRLKAEEQRKADLESQLAAAQHLVATVDVNAIRVTLDGPVTLTPEGDGVRLEGQATDDKVLEGIVPRPLNVASPMIPSSNQHTRSFFAHWAQFRAAA